MLGAIMMWIAVNLDHNKLGRSESVEEWDKRAESRK